MKTHTQIVYDLTDESDPENLVYHVTIRDETKTIVFRKHSDGSYYGSPHQVYVSITPPIDHSYENKVRRSYLKLNSKRELVDLYSVMNKKAVIVSWRNSELGDLYKGNESLDSHQPVPLQPIKVRE